MLILKLDLKKGCHLKATANNDARINLLVLLFTCIWYENCSFFPLILNRFACSKLLILYRYFAANNYLNVFILYPIVFQNTLS